MNAKKPVSIVDVAKLAGVSTATVSHVINKTGRYSKATETKVRETIEKCGYVSNNAARSLKSSSSHTVGLIIPNINNDFFSSIAASIERFFDERDYSLFICNTDNDPLKEIRYFKKLDSMQTDGIMVISCQNYLDDELISRNIPIVLIDRAPANAMALKKVVSDAREGVYKATEALIKKGCRRIVFVSSYLSTYVRTNRVSGYLDALREHQLPFTDDMIIQLKQGPSLINAEAAIVEYISEGHQVDGVVCTSDNQAIGTMVGLARMDLKVPEDVKVFGFDNQLQSRICTPSLSTVQRDPALMGTTAARTLLQLIDGEEDVPDEKVISCTLIERRSTQ